MNANTNATRLKPLLARVLPYLLVGGVALWLRVADLGGFVNEDEIRYWLNRSHTFLNALQSGDLAATAISTHPGVTTMWLGSAGIMLRRTLQAWGVLAQSGVDFPVRLAFIRLPVVLVHVGGLLLSYHLLRRLLARNDIALLAALFWATDPFITALSRLLHVDGLAMTFGTLSILAACSYWHLAPRRRWLVVSGVCAGLAILSKSPALAVVPIVGLLALWSVWLSWLPAQRTSNETTLAHLLVPLLVWGLMCGATMVVVWPAFWVNPLRVYDLYRIGVEVEGGSPHVQGNFFLGQEDNEPGWLFYPVALVLRTTPWSLAGVLLVPFALFFATRPGTRADVSDSDSDSNNNTSPVRLSLPTPAVRTCVILAATVVVFVAGLSLFPKKLNRYIVPAFPALDVLAAVGVMWLSQVVAAYTGTGGRDRRWVGAVRLVLPAVVGVAAVVNAVWWHPYGIAAFNQVFGGAQAGPRTFLVGTGEGLEQVAAWLNQQPDITGVVTVCTMPPPLQPYMQPGAYAGPPDGDDLPDQTGYVVVYIRNVWGVALPPFDRFYQQEPPIHVVTIHGVEYAWIYQVPQPVAHRVDADFGSAIRLYGYTADATAAHVGGSIALTLQWEVRQPVPDDVLLFVHVLNASGEQVAQIDVPPGGPQRPASTWQPHGYVEWTHPVPLPADLPPGDYWLALGLYHPDDFSRLELAEPAAWVAQRERDTAGEPPDDGPHALFLLPVRVEEGQGGG